MAALHLPPCLGSQHRGRLQWQWDGGPSGAGEALFQVSPTPTPWMAPSFPSPHPVTPLHYRLYSSGSTRPQLNMLFLATGGGKLSYFGSKEWLEENINEGGGGTTQSDKAHIILKLSLPSYPLPPSLPSLLRLLAVGQCGLLCLPGCCSGWPGTELPCGQGTQGGLYAGRACTGSQFCE